MGNLTSQVISRASPAHTHQPPAQTLHKRKRDSESDEEDKVQDEHLNTPQKKKLKSTSEYIYETLFVNGENSDVTIIALGKKWPLHKLYLCQAHYFSSMFKGPWLEANQESICMEIPDDSIDQPALTVALGSLYRDDVTISPKQVIPVLAAATLLGLDELITQCADVMKNAISEASVCPYHQAAVMYAQVSVSNLCQDWLEKNIMTKQTPALLRDISVDMMSTVVASANLFVMQVEMDVYSMLRKWLFLKMRPLWEGKTKCLGGEAEAYFKSHESSHRRGFLESETGRPFAYVYRQLRLCHVINDLSSTRIMEHERIIPNSWLSPLYRQQWLHMLKIEQGQHTNLESVDEAVFNQASMRCGRILHKDGQYCWRWTGYNFGLDLLVSFTSKLILFKRNALTQNCPNFVSLQDKRPMMYRLRISSLNSLGQTVGEKDTGIKVVQLGKDEEAFILGMGRKLTFPLYISCNFLIYTPQSPAQPPGGSNSSDTAPPSGGDAT